jgi:hypothetical protein
MSDITYESLLEKVLLNSGKKLPDNIVAGIDRLLKASGLELSRRAVMELGRRDVCPSNVYGFLETRIYEYKQQEKEEVLSRTRWKTGDENCASAVEWSFFFNITSEILLWHTLGIAEYNPQGIAVALSVTDFIKSGYPKTWSPILDHFMAGYCKVSNMEQHTREDFLGEYFAILVAQREKRTNKNAELFNGDCGNIK